MAISVDTVYQKVLAICNKEQRGYITPQEFNLLADRAQYEIFENYFNEIRNAERKPKNQQQFSDIVEQAEEKLQFFKTTNTSSFGASGGSSIALPANCYKFISLERGDGSSVANSDFMYPVEIVSQRELRYILNNPLTAPTAERTIAVREEETEGDLDFFPAATSQIVFRSYYYRKPHPPKWTYVVVNEQALYNQSAPDAQDFQLHSSEEEKIVTKILQLAGIIIKQPDIQQAAMASHQINNQEKNN